MNIRKYLMIIILGILGVQSNAVFSKVTVNIEFTSFMVNEWINLEISVDERVSSNALDLTPLQKSFIIKRPSVSNNRSIINGVSTQKTTWTTSIRARSVGQVTIPPLTVNNVSSQGINVLVLPQSNSATSSQRSFIETEIEFEQVYVQQQFLYTIKLYTLERIERGTISPPSLDNADVAQVGDYQASSEIVNGQRYQVHRWQFAIVAKNNGEYSLSAPVFEGEMTDNRRQSFGMFRSTKPITVSGNATQISVLPIPDGMSDGWMPAEFLQLTESWKNSAGGSDYVVGDPITRTLTLTSLGLREEQLVDINTLYPPSLKVYADQPTTQSEIRDGRLVAQRIETEAVIPNQPGTFVLPEVVVPWFNIITKKIEYAKIAARSIKVAQAEDAPVTQTAPVSNNRIPMDCDVITDDQPKQPPLTDGSYRPNFNVFWLIGLGVLWIVTLIAWLLHVKQIKKIHHNNRTSKVEKKAKGNHQTLALVKHAIAEKRGADVVTGLEVLLRQQLQTNASLSECLNQVNDPLLSNAVQQLLNALYAQGSDKHAIDWKQLEKSILPLVNIKHKQTVRPALVPLYPSK